MEHFNLSKALQQFLENWIWIFSVYSEPLEIDTIYADYSTKMSTELSEYQIDNTLDFA